MPIHRLHPPSYETKIPEDAPLLFEAGPIQGARDWQGEATGKVQQMWSTKPNDLYVASPRRLNAVRSDFTPAEKSRQIRWERTHINRAADYGAIIFWFAAQDPEIDYPKGRAYAQTTRIEIGKVMGWKRFMPDLNIIIGFDPEYRGGSKAYIHDEASALDLPVYDSLEYVCEQAVKAVTAL